MACLKAKFIGNSENMILKEKADEFRRMFYELEVPPADSPKNVLDIYYFRTQSATNMQNLVDALKNIGAPVKREVVAVRGGC
jgi:hypothetical protein